jgi:hypothetical protein
MHEYTGANDGMRYSDKELDPMVVEKRIRSLMKSPRKKPLKFGMAMFENGSCPSVSYASAIIFYDTFTLILTDVFICHLKSLSPADFAHPLRRSNPKPTAAEEVVHSSGNKEEMAGDVEDTTRTTQEKVIPKKWAGSRKTHGGGGKSTDSRRFEAQRRAELETPSENTATINLPKSR